MEVKYTTSNGRISVAVSGDTQKDIFAALSSFQEVFEETTCGACKGENIKFVVRTDKEENNYYELHCKDCRSRLAFGAHKKGGSLFPKRKNGEVWLDNSGWVKWNPETKKEE